MSDNLAVKYTLGDLRRDLEKVVITLEMEQRFNNHMQQIAWANGYNTIDEYLKSR